MNLDYRHLKPYREYQISRLLGRRLMVLRILFALGFVLYGEMFWYLQIVKGDQYRHLAEENRLRRRIERPARGILLDHMGNLLVANHPSFSVYLDRDRSQHPREDVEALARVLGEPAEPMLERLEKARGMAAFMPVLLRPDVDLAVAARIEARRTELPAIDVEMDAKRNYLLGPAAAHTIGYLSEATLEELKSRPNLFLGDRVGRAGVERAYDDDLRGRPGILLDEVNAWGKSLGTVAVERPARPGRALKTTLDAQMFRDVEEGFAGRGGAAVFLDPETGGVRAIYSAPGFDPNVFAGRIPAKVWTSLIENPRTPLQDRALSSAFPPGSTFKVVMAAAGLEEGTLTPETRFFCPGGQSFYGRFFHCHKKAGHGSVNVVEAIIQSCDVFFYNTGQRLGVDGIAKWAKRFGMGAPTGIKLEGESPGLVPSSEWKQRVRGQPWYAGETISVSIGQGLLLATPLQMAVVAADVANGGYRVTPHFVDRPGDAPPPEPVGFSESTLALLRAGMEGVVESDRGTARRARVAGVHVAGKTGTAQVVGKDSGAEDPGDHAWFIGYGPTDKPQLAWCVFLEHGGHGGEAAAPISSLVLRRYLERQHVIEKQPDSPKAPPPPPPPKAPDPQRVAHALAPR